jgi:hypothetical protein
MLVARNWILHNKKNFKNSWLVAIKKLFTARTFPLALCAWPYPPPFGLNGHTVRMVFAVGHVDNVDSQLIPQPVGVWTMWTTCFCIVQLVHKLCTGCG